MMDKIIYLCKFNFEKGMTLQINTVKTEIETNS